MTMPSNKLSKSFSGVTSVFLLPVILLFGSLLLLTGCDFSARWDLRRAEKMLKEADKWNAQHWCETEYNKAQRLFEEAMDNARERRINEARDLADQAHIWAETARDLAKARYLEMEEEKARLKAID